MISIYTNQTALFPVHLGTAVTAGLFLVSITDFLELTLGSRAPVPPQITKADEPFLINSVSFLWTEGGNCRAKAWRTGSGSVTSFGMPLCDITGSGQSGETES